MTRSLSVVGRALSTSVRSRYRFFKYFHQSFLYPSFEGDASFTFSLLKRGKGWEATVFASFVGNWATPADRQTMFSSGNALWSGRLDLVAWNRQPVGVCFAVLLCWESIRTSTFICPSSLSIPSGITIMLSQHYYHALPALLSCSPSTTIMLSQHYYHECRLHWPALSCFLGVFWYLFMCTTNCQKEIE